MKAPIFLVIVVAVLLVGMDGLYVVNEALEENDQF